MKLDLDELEKIATELQIEQSRFEPLHIAEVGTLYIGAWRDADGGRSGVYARDILLSEFGVKIEALLKALPELIAIAQVKYDNDAEAMWRGD